MKRKVIAFVARAFASSFRPACILATSTRRRPRYYSVIKANSEPQTPPRSSTSTPPMNSESSSSSSRNVAGSSSSGKTKSMSSGASYAPGTLGTVVFTSHFVDELPGDPHEGPEQRQVYQAAYSRVTPSPPMTTDMTPLWKRAMVDGFVRKPPPNVPRALAGWSPDASKLLRISRLTDDRELEVRVLGGEGELLPGMKPYAACYGGHQFGSWAGQLGDGRAIVLGETNGWEVQLKGAGRTPYSRSADGRAVLRSSIREFLCSEAMYFAGIPTTRALSIVTTGAGIVRDMFYAGQPELEAGAVVTRLAPTFLRLGNFQLAASRGDNELVKKLADYAIRHHFPDIREGDYVGFAHEVSRRNAIMVARWMSIGFVHGVMNTDNFSILGLTIDYGPYGFLDEYDPDYTPNTTDAQGKRYTYERQPKIAHWNILQFVQALVPVTDIDSMQAVVDGFMPHYKTEYERVFGAKLGLPEMTDKDRELLQDFFEIMKDHKCDWTNTWRALIDVDPDNTAEEVMQKVWLPKVLVGKGKDKDKDLKHLEWNTWTERYLERINGIERDVELMKRVNPVYILRNYLAQLAIDKANKGDFDEINRLYLLLSKPWELQKGMERYAQEPPDWAQKRGVKVNSCSS